MTASLISRQSGRSPLPEPSPKVGRSPSFNPKDKEVAAKLEEQQASAETGPGAELGALRGLGEQLVAEQEKVEEAVLKPNGEDGRWKQDFWKVVSEQFPITAYFVHFHTISRIMSYNFLYFHPFKGFLTRLRSESTMSCRTLCESSTSMINSCQTLCASSVTDLVDTENTPFIDRWEHLVFAN